LNIIQVKAKKTIKLRAAAMAPKETAIMQCFNRWCQAVEKETDNKVQIDVYWAASLLKAQDAYEGTGQGLADICMDVPAYHPSLTPFMTVTQLGYITKAIDAPTRAVTKLYKENEIFRKQFTDDNVKIMSFVAFAPNIMASKSPIHSLEDLNGKKIRALGRLNTVVERLGATPVAIPAPDLYEALNRNIVEGFTGFPLSAVHGFKLEEVTEYFLDYGYGNYLVMMIGFNMDKWNKLPQNIKESIKKVNNKSIDMYMKTYAELEPNYVKPLQKAGCDFYVLPQKEMEKWKKQVVPYIWDNWVEENKKYGPAEQFFEKYKMLVKKYEKNSKYKNPFPGLE
jgi:TRAP-type C4-dicarboxylate transport system substrate-binding protein